MIRYRWREFGIAALVCIALPPLLGRIGILNDFRALSLGQGVAIACAALALNMLMGYAGQVSLGHFALAGFGAFVSGRLTTPDPTGLPWILGVVAAVVLTAGIAFLIGLPALRLRGLYLAVATMAFAYAMEKSLFRSSLLSKGSAGVVMPPPQAGEFKFTGPDYLALALICLLVIWVVDSNVTHSRLGRAFQAIRADETVAASFGINVRANKLAAFTISGGMAGLAGSVYGHLFGSISAETFRFDRSLLLVIVVVIGGLGSRVGVVSAAAFSAIFPFLFIDIFGNAWQGIDLIVGAALLMYTVSREPEGLAGAIRHKKEVKRMQQSVHATVTQTRMSELPTTHRRDVRLREGQPILAARNVSVSFGGLKAVEDATIEVRPNRIVGLIGPNGAGKTTLFNAISGAVEHQTGRIELVSEDITAAPPHVRAAKGMGRSFQHIGLAKDLSVTENLLLAQHLVADYSTWSALVGLGPAPAKEAVLRQHAAEAVEALGFAGYANTPVKKLSGGQQRIVEIGCILSTAPEVVMLDEPSAGMAPAAVEELAVALKAMRDELGRTIFLIEHNIPLVADVCDDLYVMSEGRVIAHGPPAEILSAPAVIGAYLGGDA